MQLCDGVLKNNTEVKALVGVLLAMFWLRRQKEASLRLTVCLRLTVFLTGGARWLPSAALRAN